MTENKIEYVELEAQHPYDAVFIAKGTPRTRIKKGVVVKVTKETYEKELKQDKRWKLVTKKENKKEHK